MFASLTAVTDALSYGWSGLLFGYATAGVPMLTGMIKGKASWYKVLSSPVLAVPATILAGFATSAMQPALRGLGVANGGLVQFAAGVGITAAVGYGCGRLLTMSASKRPTYRRGALVDGAGEEDRPQLKRRSAGNERAADASSTLTLAGLSIRPEDETKHFKLIGTTGTGKSTAIREILRGALARGDRAVIADPDGGYLKQFHSARRGDVILNPFDDRSARWDLYGEITKPYDIDQLARSLIPDQDGTDRSWSGYARTFFSAVVQQTRDAGVSDVNDLYEMLVTADVKELRTLVAGTPAQPFLDEHNSRMFDSIRSVTSSAVAALQYIGEQEGAPLSVRKWVESGSGTLFIPYQAGQIAALRSTISAWMRLAIFETMNQGERDQRLWFVIDELDALGKIDGLKDALARVRKFGGRCILGLQSIAQVSGTYGRAEAQTIVENCGNTVILRCSASERGGTAAFASQLIGQREVIRTSESRSKPPLQLLPTVTRSESPSLEPAVLDSEIEQLPDLKGYLKFASSPQWRRVALSPPEVTRGAEFHDTSKFHQTDGVEKPTGCDDSFGR